MWWHSELPGAEETQHFLEHARHFSLTEGRYFRWFRGVGAVLLTTSPPRWVPVIYADSKIDPRRVPQGPSPSVRALMAFIYDRHGPLEGVHVPELYRKFLSYTDEWEPEWTEIRLRPPATEMHADSLLAVAFQAALRRRVASPWNYVLPYHGDFRSIDSGWARWQEALGRWLEPPPLSVAMFLPRVRSAVGRIGSIGSYCTAGSVATAAKDGRPGILTVGHGVKDGASVKVTWGFMRSKPGIVTWWSDPADTPGEVDLAFVQTDPRHQLGVPLTVMPGSDMEIAAVVGEYSGARHRNRRVNVFSTVWPLLDNQGAGRSWTGYKAESFDKRWVLGRGDSGAAVLKEGEGALIGHVVGDTHRHSGVIQSSEAEMAALSGIVKDVYPPEGVR